MWRWNFLNISFSFRATRTQNRDGQTDIHTDRQTDRHTYRQTDSQTDTCELLYRYANLFHLRNVRRLIVNIRQCSLLFIGYFVQYCYDETLVFQLIKLNTMIHLLRKLMAQTRQNTQFKSCCDQRLKLYLNIQYVSITYL